MPLPDNKDYQVRIRLSPLTSSAWPCALLPSSAAGRARRSVPPACLITNRENHDGTLPANMNDPGRHRERSERDGARAARH
jgi:hypothetical protein